LSVKSALKLAELLDHAIAWLKPKCIPSIIIVPFLANIHFSLGSSPKFVPDWRSPTFPGSSGTFDDIPIIEYFPENGNIVLIGDMFSAIEIIQFSKLKIDIRLLNVTEKEAILEKQPDLDAEKLKEEVIVDVSESFRTEVKEPGAFIKFELPVEST